MRLRDEPSTVVLIDSQGNHWVLRYCRATLTLSLRLEGCSCSSCAVPLERFAGELPLVLYSAAGALDQHIDWGEFQPLLPLHDWETLARSLGCPGSVLVIRSWSATQYRFHGVFQQESA